MYEEVINTLMGHLSNQNLGFAFQNQELRPSFIYSLCLTNQTMTEMSESGASECEE